MTYDQKLPYMQQELDSDIVWKVRHGEGPLTYKYRNGKDSLYTAMVEWVNGEFQSKPLPVMTPDNHVTFGMTAPQDNALLIVEGWQRQHFRDTVRKQTKLLRFLSNQAKLRYFHRAPKFKHAFEVLWNYKHTLWLDKQSFNTKWHDATNLEMTQLEDYYPPMFRHIDKSIPEGNKKIHVHLLVDCDLKLDGRPSWFHHAVDGYLTYMSLENVYSGNACIGAQ